MATVKGEKMMTLLEARDILSSCELEGNKLVAERLLYLGDLIKIFGLSANINFGKFIRKEPGKLIERG